MSSDPAECVCKIEWTTNVFSSQKWVSVFYQILKRVCDPKQVLDDAPIELIVLMYEAQWKVKEMASFSFANGIQYFPMPWGVS